MEDTQAKSEEHLNNLLNLLPDQFINLPENNRGLAFKK